MLRFAPPAAMLVWLVALNAPLGAIFIVWIPSAALQVLAAGWTLSCAERLRGSEPVVVQRTIGGLLRGSLLVQASVAALAAWPGWVIAACLLTGWPVSVLLSRRYYAS